VLRYHFFTEVSLVKQTNLSTDFDQPVSQSQFTNHVRCESTSSLKQGFKSAKLRITANGFGILQRATAQSKTGITWLWISLISSSYFLKPAGLTATAVMPRECHVGA
jgi:hypothetical protein